MVRRAHAQPFHIASNFARLASTEVALAASLGWITTVSPSGASYSRQWHITVAGLVALTSQGRS